jgi:segregation and condensation protein B
MDESNKELISKLEALLFIYGEPISVKKIAGILGVSVVETKKIAEEFKSILAERNGGLTLFEHEENLQLVTKGEYASLLQAVLKSELHEALTPASLETLSIILYAGPISRVEIDYIRGVNSSYTVRALALRGLIDRETDPARGNSFIYKASAELVRHLGVSSLSDLPEYERLRSVASSIKQTADSPKLAESDPNGVSSVPNEQ